MRNYSKTVGALAAASTLVAGYASAEIEGEVHVGYANMYEFRFVDFGNDLIEAGVDIAGEYGAIGWNAGAWYASFDAPGAMGKMGGFNSDELDLYGGVSYAVGDITFEAGYIFYHFMDAQGLDTQELYLGASYEFAFGLSLGSTWYYDFDSNNGWYWDNSVGYSIPLGECVSLDLGAGFAFADGNQAQASAKLGVTPRSSADGFQGWYLSAALPWEIKDTVTITPYVKYTDGDSGLATDTYGTAGQEYLIGGVTLAVGF